MQGAMKGRHNHRRCIERAMDSAELLCSSEGARLTSLRREVLEFVWRGHQAVKAYEILAHLSAERRSPKPPTVYRALQFLLERGLVHRLESLSAFVGCPEPGARHAGQFLICEKCGWVSELKTPGIHDAIAEGAERAGFRVGRETVEVMGVCQACDGSAGPVGGRVP